MKIGFNAKNEIKSNSELFGRSKEFDFLVGYAKRRSCVQVIGARRFGKTSILKSLDTYFSSSTESDIYPIYIDFTEVGTEINGTANVYRYLIALTVSKLTLDKSFNGEEEIRGIKLKATKLWEDSYDALSEVSSTRLQEIFKDLITLFSELTDKTFLFLFDEYEYLFKYGFDQPTGFTTLRNFSSKLNSKGLNPFGFFIAGILTWENLCSLTKSGELNVIDQTIRVKPISLDEFSRMWEHETALLVDCPVDVLNASEVVYKLSGGVPFYGKSIGSYWYMNKVKPEYSLLKSHFNEVYNSLVLEQKDILHKLAVSNSVLKENENVFELRDAGLIGKVGNQYSIRIGFLKDYLISIDATRSLKTQEDLPESFGLTDQITALISNINSTCKNKGRNFIFDILNEDESLYRDLRIPVTDRNQAVQFASSLYRIIYEKTKANDKNKAKLPLSFSKGNLFISMVDIMRHTLGKGHIHEKMSLSGSQMTKNEMYIMLLGSKNEPSTSEDFSKIQLNTLNMFVCELKELKKIIDRVN